MDLTIKDLREVLEEAGFEMKSIEEIKRDNAPQPARERFYAVNKDAERLTAQCIGDAVAEYLDDACWPWLTEGSVLDWVLTVHEWEQEDQPTLAPVDVKDWLESEFYELVDPDDGLEPPPDLVDAIFVFCDAVEKHFPVWSCHIVGNFKVRVTGSPEDPKVEVINDVD